MRTVEAVHVVDEFVCDGEVNDIFGNVVVLKIAVDGNFAVFVFEAFDMAEFVFPFAFEADRDRVHFLYVGEVGCPNRVEFGLEPGVITHFLSPMLNGKEVGYKDSERRKVELDYFCSSCCSRDETCCATAVSPSICGRE